MPKLRTSRICRKPTREEQSKVFFLGHKLGELFDEEEIEDFTAAAKRRIVGEFFYATEKNPRYKVGSDRRRFRRTDNYIWGLGAKPSELARYVGIHMHHPFIHPSQLPAELCELSPKLIEMVIARAQYDVILAVVQTMHNREIWYDEGIGIWQVCQSSVDDFLIYKRLGKALVKIDDRTFHGRVRSQSEQRGIPEAVSVSFA